MLALIINPSENPSRKALTVEYAHTSNSSLTLPCAFCLARASSSMVLVTLPVFFSLLLAHVVAHPVSLHVPLSAEFPTYFPSLHTLTHSFSVITFHLHILSKHTIFSVSHQFHCQNVAIAKQTSYHGRILIRCDRTGKHLHHAGRGAPQDQD